jgi:hypothetical protein
MTVRRATVRVSDNLEREARANIDLPMSSVPFGALVRIGLAVLAGYTVSDGFRKFYLDPASKKYQELMQTETDCQGKSDVSTDH